MIDRAENLAAERLRLALEMFELGESMMLERLRRQFPGANEAELQDLIERWLGTRLEAEHADTDGSSMDGRGHGL